MIISVRDDHSAIHRAFSKAASSIAAAVAELPDIHGELRRSIGTDVFLGNLTTSAQQARTGEELLRGPYEGSFNSAVGTIRDVLWLEDFVTSARATLDAGGRFRISNFSGAGDSESMIRDIADRFAQKRDDLRD